MPALAPPCPGCNHPRHPAHYLCRTCWAALTSDARRKLTPRGADALRRLRQLHDQLRAGTKPADVHIQ